MKQLTKTILFGYTLFSCLIINAQSTQTGVAIPGHSPGGGGVLVRYLGWDASAASNSIPLSIEHRGTNRINFFTGATQRMTLLGTASGASAGFVGIGSGFNTPVSLLHISSLANGTGEVFRTTAPANVDHTWRMNTVFDAFRFYIQNPANTVEARLVNEVDGEINFFTNFAGSGGARSVSIQRGIGDVVHGEVALGNALPPNFDAQSRLHLHKTTTTDTAGGNFIQFTSSNSTNGDTPTQQDGFRVGVPSLTRDAWISQGEEAPMRFLTNNIQRVHIQEQPGVNSTDGFVGINNTAPTARLDVNGDLRIRDVQPLPADALLLGLRQNPAIGQDLNVRRLDFNNDSTTYLGGNGQWVNLPPPTGVTAENGLSLDPLDNTVIEFGQDLNAIFDPAQLQNDREIPMNNHNIVFTDDNATNGNVVNRIGIGTAGPVARLDVRVNTNPGVAQSSPVAMRVFNNQNSSPGSANTAIMAETQGTNYQNLGLDLVVRNGTNYNTGVLVNVESTLPNVGQAWNVGGGFTASNGQQNYGVGGGAFSDVPIPGAYNFGVQGRAEGNDNNVAGEFKAFSSNIGTDYTSNVGVSSTAWGNAFLNIGVQGRAYGPNGGSLNHYGGIFSAENGIDRNIGVHAFARDGVIQNIALRAIVVGNAPISYAGLFEGDVLVTGDMSAATINGISDQMFKQDVDDLSGAMAIIEQLQPRTFLFDTVGFPQFRFENDQQMGFIAQELETVLPSLVSTISTIDDLDSMGLVITPAVTFKQLEYTELIPLLTAGIQEQQAVIEAQQAELNEKDSIIDAILNRLDLIEQCLHNSGICNTNLHAPQQNSLEEQQRTANSIDVQLRNGESIVLNQNVPNPFAEKTVITYFIPESIGKAQIHFYNNEGKLINTVELKERGNGQINVFADDLSSGVYTYSLIADGRFISTKRVVKE